MSDRLQEVEEAKRNAAYGLKIFGVCWRSIRYQPITTILMWFGATAVPGALMGAMSGIFFGSTVPSSAPMADKMGNWLGASVVRPFAATAVVATETTYRAQLMGYKPDTKQQKQEQQINLDKATLVKLENFSKNNKVLFTSFKRP